MKSRLLLSMATIALVVAGLRAGNSGQDVIVKLKEGHTIQELDHIQGMRIVRVVGTTRIYLIHIDGDSNWTALAKIHSDPAVEDSETNRRIKLTSAGPSSASSGLDQSAMELLDGRTMTSFNGAIVLKAYAEQPFLRLVGATDVRKISTGAGTRVAYIDTGVDPMHPAIRPWLDRGVDLVNGRSVSEFDGLSHGAIDLLNQSAMELLDHRLMFLLDQSLLSILSSASTSSAFPAVYGHGTLVAGLIHIIAPDARIIPIKAFDPNGYTTMFTLIEAVYKAIDLDADVLNMSFSSTENSNIFRKAIDAARAAGITPVASAGNDAREGKDIYPAAYGNVYGIAATDLNDRLADFSNYGFVVSATAPGAFVISTAPGNKYAAAWGTSFSAPIVSGAIALAASSNGHGQSDSSTVINTADSIDALNPGFEKKLGKGRINLRRALKTR